MRVTYIGHSGFLVETEEACLLFDYYYGELPKLPEGSRLYVFVSHRHEDHFNPEIFKLEQFYNTTFFLAHDIRLSSYGLRKYNIPETCRENILSFRFGEDRQVDELRIRTYHSTDSGVAYLVTLQGKHIYHAGDHNWWHWEGAGKSYNNNMAANYKREIDRMAQAEKCIDVAFVPLDPRLGESYYYGLKYFCENINADIIFPMHFGEAYDCQERFVKEYGYGEKIRKIQYPGQKFLLSHK